MRRVTSITKGMPASDGAGVNMTRVIGTAALDQLDPFLLFDVFESDDPGDYIAGFPAHPHRGFETVTYMFAGQMRHQDSAGNEGVIRPGGVQWMTAGRGIIHSEMPEQEGGLMWGTQLWVNLPREDKMVAPAYQKLDADSIAAEHHADGVEVRVVAGTTNAGTVGAVTGRPTEPIYLDVRLPPQTGFEQAIPESHNAFVFVVEGTLQIDDARVAARSVAILGHGSGFAAAAPEDGCRFLLIAGKSIGEPIARAGPFVMNTADELKQAFEDYRSGRF